MTRKLLVLGAGGHGRVVADIALSSGYERVAFLDDAFETLKTASSSPAIGPMSAIRDMASEWPDAIAAVGNNVRRLELFESLRKLGYGTPSIVHPSAIVSRGAQIGHGVFVAPTVVINVGARIDDAAILNTGARIDHDCVIGAACHIAPGATLSGGVEVGARAWLGTGCAVRQNVKIGEDAVIGVGAAVVSDLAGGATYAGVPARMFPIRS